MRPGNGPKLLRLVLLGLVLLALPVQVAAEVYVEGYLGGVQPGPADMTFTTFGNNPNLPVPNVIQEVRKNQISGSIDPAVLGGIKVGTWFVREGFLAFNYPEWMKYLGFYLDLSFHRLEYQRQNGVSPSTFLGN